MKKFFITMLVIAGFAGRSMAQDADPAVTTIQMIPSSIAIGATSVMNVTLGNNGNDDIRLSSLRFRVTISSNATITGLDASSTTTWGQTTLTVGNGNTITLVNSQAIIPAFSSETIRINVMGTVLGGPSTFTGFVSYLTGGVPPFVNQGDASGGVNNTGTSQLTVAAVVAVKFNDITAEPSDCSAKLKWSTSMEEEGTSFDVEYSADGRNFVKVTTVAGRKNAGGSSYEYAYNQGNGKGYYRLKMGNADGGYAYSKVVNANIKCNAKKVFIYPNPVKTDEILHVNVSNFEGKVTGELMSAEGKKVLTRVLQNGSNLVMLASLPQGNYSFKVTDDKGEMQNYKVVIVK